MEYNDNGMNGVIITQSRGGFKKVFNSTKTKIAIIELCAERASIFKEMLVSLILDTYFR